MDGPHHPLRQCHRSGGTHHHRRNHRIVALTPIQSSFDSAVTDEGKETHCADFAAVAWAVGTDLRAGSNDS